MNLFNNADLVRIQLHRAPSSAAELRTVLKLSQPTVSRTLGQMADSVQAFGRGPSTKYALKRDVRGLGAEFPLYRVGPAGAVEPIGKLIAVEPRGSVVHFNDRRTPPQYFTEFPYWLEDARPSGFLGRLIAKRLPDHGYPENVSHWSNDDTLHYWATQGVDLIGDLIVGSHSFQKWSMARDPVSSHDLGDLERFATDTLAKGAAGSSAGGEQPKFLIVLSGNPCLVKFSPTVSTEIGRRRAELLVCEHLALKTLSDNDIPAAKSSLHFGESRVFLITHRFDRTVLRSEDTTNPLGTRSDTEPQYGRKGVISLRALDNEFTGVFLGSWKELGDALLRKKKLARETYSSLLLVHYFGLLIGNTDMHSGNLSFYCDDKAPPYRPTSLAPIYDMLPMTAAPSHEHVPPLTPHFPTLDPQDRSTYQRAARLAVEFWKKVAANEWLGDDWKPFAKEWMRFIEGTVDAEKDGNRAERY